MDFLHSVQSWNGLKSKIQSLFKIIKMPIFDGQNWFHVRLSGRTILQFLHCIVWKSRKHTVEITEFYCCHATIFSQKFRQINFLRKKLCKLLWRKKIAWHTMWKFRNFTATVFSQKFRQNNVLLKNFTKLIWRKKFAWHWQWISRFSTLCTALCTSLHHY